MDVNRWGDALTQVTHQNWWQLKLRVRIRVD